VDNRDEVKAFLSSRRAKITPEQAGLQNYSRNRRVPGLRRSEVADLAGVSVEYYAQLEHGNLAGASDSVLDALARALQLDDAEQAHLANLARAAGPATRRRRTPAAPQIRPSVTRLLDLMTDIPAFVNNGRGDVLAANPLAQALYAPMFDDPVRPANHARFAFLNPRARDFWRDWNRIATDTVAMLRTEAGRDPPRQGPHRPGRRAQHPQRGLPDPLGRPRRPPAPHRAQTVPPPRRRRPEPELRNHAPARRPRPDAHPAERPSRLSRRRRPTPPDQLGSRPVVG
jgi:transcriptional regulator with XRE-family HTH domain